MPDFREITDRVTVMHHDFVEGTCVVVSGDDRTMVIDSGALPKHAHALGELLSSRGQRCDVFGLTHGHGDHVGGFVGMRADRVIADAGALPRALKAVDTIASWAKIPTASAARRLIDGLNAATIPARVDLGGTVVEVIRTPGHTSDSICFSVESILIAGDTVVTNIPPAFADGDSGELTTTHDRLLARAWEILVPGHGPAISGNEATQLWLENQQIYLESLSSAVDEALETTPAGRVLDLVDARPAGLPDSADILRRLRNNVRAMIVEKLGKV